MELETYKKASKIMEELEDYETVYESLGKYPKVDWVHIQANARSAVYLPNEIIDQVGRLISEICQQKIEDCKKEIEKL